MSVQQSLAAGLIGLVVAGAGGVGVYNLATTGCFLGSCSSTASTGDASPVGLRVEATDAGEPADSCCPLGDGASKLQSVALEEQGEACEGPGSCTHAQGKTIPAAGQVGADDGCCGCGACEAENAPEAKIIDAALPSDD